MIGRIRLRMPFRTVAFLETFLDIEIIISLDSDGVIRREKYWVEGITLMSKVRQLT